MGGVIRVSKWANVLPGCDQNSLSSYTPVAKWGRQQGFGRRQQHDPKADYLQRWRSLAPRSAEVNLCVCVYVCSSSHERSPRRRRGQARPAPGSISVHVASQQLRRREFRL